MTEPGTAAPGRWKKWFAIGAGIGAGAIVAVTAVLVVILWYSSRPTPARPWNRTAITATFADLYLTQHQDRIVLTFRYTLENHTGRDWRLPGSDALYKVLPKDKGLERDPTLKWDGGPSVPAGQHINVGLLIEYPYRDGTGKPNEKLNNFTNRRLSEIDGFAALDEANRYDLRLPKPPEGK